MITRDFDTPNLGGENGAMPFDDTNNPYAPPPEVDRSVVGTDSAASPITVRYRFTPEETATAQAENLRQLFPHKITRISFNITVATVCLICTNEILDAIELYAKMDIFHPGRLFMACIPIAFGIYWFFFRRRVNYWWLLRRATKSGLFAGDVVWQIGPDRLSLRAELCQDAGVRGSMETISEFSCDWASYIKVARTSKGLLLYLNPKTIHWLPRHGFADNGGFDCVVAWAREKVPQFIAVDRE